MNTYIIAIDIGAMHTGISLGFYSEDYIPEESITLEREIDQTVKDYGKTIVKYIYDKVEGKSFVVVLEEFYSYGNSGDAKKDVSDLVGMLKWEFDCVMQKPSQKAKPHNFIDFLIKMNPNKIMRIGRRPFHIPTKKYLSRHAVDACMHFMIYCKYLDGNKLFKQKYT